MWIRSLILCALAVAVSFAQSSEVFIEKPYLQLGNAPSLAAKESLVLMWHAKPNAEAWLVELRDAKGTVWRRAAAPTVDVVNAPDIPSHHVYRNALTELAPGGDFAYRVRRGGNVVFESTGRARKSAAQPVRFALFGDCGANTPGQRAVANQVFLANPDFAFVPGDIVYSSGRISEYREKFYPVYNADTAGPENGAPLLRSVPFIAAPGNHDTALSNFQRFGDALGYFLYWDQPLNGPIASGTPGSTHFLAGADNGDARVSVLAAAGRRYPLMANFSFDYGNAHWTVLDSNTYMDWSNPALLAWLRKDLAAASSATWRFVAFHHPGFNSSRAHFSEQWMRLLSPVFEEARVDVVFAGHVHNYQRSFPMTFAPKAWSDGSMRGPKGEVEGDWKLDRDFRDGVSKKPAGVVYIVSGAGGAGLYDPAQMNDPDTWQSFTDKFISSEHSFSLVDVSGTTFQLKQISASGKELDSFRIVK